MAKRIVIDIDEQDPYLTELELENLVNSIKRILNRYLDKDEYRIKEEN